MSMGMMVDNSRCGVGVCLGAVAAAAAARVPCCLLLPTKVCGLYQCEQIIFVIVGAIHSYKRESLPTQMGHTQDTYIKCEQ